INAQVPYEIAPGQADFVVTANGNVGFQRYVKMNASAPSFFITADGQAIAQNQDGTLNTPANPAQAGSFVTIYLTGQGLSTNQVPTGAAAPDGPLSQPNAAANVQVGGVRGTIAFIGLTPRFVGLSQLNLQLSPDTPAGNDTMTLTLGTSSTSARLVVKK